MCGFVLFLSLPFPALPLQAGCSSGLRASTASHATSLVSHLFPHVHSHSTHNWDWHLSPSPDPSLWAFLPWVWTSHGQGELGDQHHGCNASPGHESSRRDLPSSHGCVLLSTHISLPFSPKWLPSLLPTSLLVKTHGLSNQRNNVIQTISSLNSTPAYYASTSKSEGFRSEGVARVQGTR